AVIRALGKMEGNVTSDRVDEFMDLVKEEFVGAEAAEDDMEVEEGHDKEDDFSSLMESVRRLSGITPI
ncbi:MAG: hypothetical protein D6698_10260, partial [Gammaproteobacteria bacterium]